MLYLCNSICLIFTLCSQYDVSVLRCGPLSFNYSSLFQSFFRSQQIIGLNLTMFFNVLCQISSSNLRIICHSMSKLCHPYSLPIISSLRQSFLSCYTDFNLKQIEKCKQMRGHIDGRETKTVSVHKHSGTDCDDKLQNCMT